MQTSTFLKTTLALLFVLTTAPIATQAADKPADKPDAVQQEVAAVITSMASRWANGNWKSIPEELWDTSEPQPMYLAEEQPGWLVGWEAVREYFNPKRGPGYQAFDYTASNIQTRMIAKDLAMAIWTIDWQMKMGRGDPIHETLRANAVFRKTAAGWKFIHYAESPKAALVYIQELFSKDVTPGFRARIEQERGKPSQ